MTKGENSPFICTIILLDEEEWTGTIVSSPDGDQIWVHLDEKYTMSEVFQSFSDVNKTERIISIIEIPMSRHEERKEYIGYTKLTNLQIQGNEVVACLRKS